MKKRKTTALIEAVLNNDFLTVQSLIGDGCNIDGVDDSGYGALHYAAQNFNMEVAEFLIKNKATIDLQDMYGNSPLFKAVFNSKGRGEMITLLLKNGADMHLKNNSGISPLKLAETIANYPVLQFLK